MLNNSLKDSHWLAQKLGISYQNARTLYKKSDIPYLRLNRLIKYRECDIEQWLEKNIQSGESR